MQDVRKHSGSMFLLLVGPPRPFALNNLLRGIDCNECSNDSSWPAPRRVTGGMTLRSSGWKVEMVVRGDVTLVALKVSSLNLTFYLVAQASLSMTKTRSP